MPGPLSGRTVAISVSTAPDMGKLGYPSREVDRALLAVCGALVRAGARVAYGGNLDPSGYTFRIFTFLAKAYAVREQAAPFLHYLPASELRRAEFDVLERLVREGNGIVETRFVLEGQAAATLMPLDGAPGLRWASGRFERLDDPGKLAAIVVEHAGEPPSQALTTMRRLVSARSDARIIMGGKMGLLDDPMDRYGGDMPGVVEEALYTLEGLKPLIVLGAFGGAARDVAIALGLLPANMRVPRGQQSGTYNPAIGGLERFRETLGPLRAQLSEIAQLDRIEVMARTIVHFLGDRP